MKTHSNLHKKENTLSNHEDEVISTARESQGKGLLEPEPSDIKGIQQLGLINQTEPKKKANLIDEIPEISEISKKMPNQNVNKSQNNVDHGEKKE